LGYAATFWGQHLRDSDFDQIDSRSHALGKNPIIDFLHANLLEWLECLSLFMELPVAIQTLKRLEDVFKVGMESKTNFETSFTNNIGEE
jgi:hypothetical protein